MATNIYHFIQTLHSWTTKINVISIWQWLITFSWRIPSTRSHCFWRHILAFCLSLLLQTVIPREGRVRPCCQMLCETLNRWGILYVMGAHVHTQPGISSTFRGPYNSYNSAATSWHSYVTFINVIKIDITHLVCSLGLSCYQDVSSCVGDWWSRVHRNTHRHWTRNGRIHTSNPGQPRQLICGECLPRQEDHQLKHPFP